MTNKRANKVNVTDKYVCFHSGIFSNWYPCTINYMGWKFKSSEQIYMWYKAIHFNDNETAVQILKVHTPKEAKELGRQVKGFDNKEWDKVKFDYMLRAVYAKFSQNPHLQEKLLSSEYEGKNFVEGSPTDKIWGVGIDWQDNSIADAKNWKGMNLLGLVLDETKRLINYVNSAEKLFK